MSELFPTDTRDTAAYQAAVMRQLTEAGQNGLALTRIVSKKAAARTTQERVLREMERNELVKSLRKAGSTRFWLAEHLPPQRTPEEQADEVLRRVLPEQRRERLLTLAKIREELLKGLGINDAAIRTCLRVLEQEGLVVKLTEGTKSFYAYAPSLRALLGEGASAAAGTAGPATQPEPVADVAPQPIAPTSPAPSSRATRPTETPLPVTNQRVIEAYRSVRMQRRLPDVEIARLREVLHCTVDELKPVVQRLCEQGTFIPGKGDWSFATTAARAAAVLIQDEQHLFVRMKD